MKKIISIIAISTILVVAASTAVVSLATYKPDIPLYELESSAYLEAIKNNSNTSSAVSKEEEKFYFQKIERYYQLYDEKQKLYDSSGTILSETLAQYHDELDSAALKVLQHHGVVDQNKTLQYYRDSFDSNDENNEYIMLLVKICDTLNTIPLTAEEKTTLLYTLKIDAFSVDSDSKQLMYIYNQVDFSRIPTFKNTARTDYTKNFERKEKSEISVRDEELSQ